MESGDRHSGTHLSIILCLKQFLGQVGSGRASPPPGFMPPGRKPCHKQSANQIRYIYFYQVGMWLSLVERSVRDAEARGSNPRIPTNASGIRNIQPAFLWLQGLHPFLCPPQDAPHISKQTPFLQVSLESRDSCRQILWEK